MAKKRSTTPKQQSTTPKQQSTTPKRQRRATQEQDGVPAEATSPAQEQPATAATPTPPLPEVSQEEQAAFQAPERVCGLDVHQDMIMACLWIQPHGKRKPTKEIRQFGAFRDDLERLRDWLVEQQCQQVGMESTGVYWVPVYTVLEGHFELFLGNARHLKNVPARKTDQKDAEWLAELLHKGLIRKSFVPDQAIRELRKLVRYRRNLVQAQSEERNLILKQLEITGTKLASVASDVFGVSGMRILHALADGKLNVGQMADLAVKQLRKKIPQLERALRGELSANDRFILKLQLERLAQHDQALEALETHIKQLLQPYERELELLQTIPGVGFTVAMTIIAELGTDLKAFVDEHRLAAWAGLAPGNNFSNGKKVGNSQRHGNVFLQSILVEAAHAAIRVKNSFWKAKFYRLKARRGHKRALIAIAHKILVTIFKMLKRNEAFREKGEGALDAGSKRKVIKRKVKELEALGFRVTLEPLATGT